MNLPAVYCNALDLNISLSDICVTLNEGVGPQQRVYMSHVMAKSLAQKLQQMIDYLETATGFKVPTTDQVQAAVDEYRQAGAEGREG